jgi:nucleotide-binding universal stress UspA family protein
VIPAREEDHRDDLMALGADGRRAERLLVLGTNV